MSPNPTNVFQFPGFAHRVHLDFETRSEINLMTAGAHRYAEHDSTQVLVLCWSVDDGEIIEEWLPHEAPMPSHLHEILTDPCVAKVAFNAAFERLILKHCCGVDVPIKEWRCTMVASYYMGFAGGLDAILAAIGLEKKDRRGNSLKQKFSKPAPKNHKVDWYTPGNSPVEFREFVEYCRQDVKVERQLLIWLSKYPMMPSWDWDRYALDQRINDRGVSMSSAMARGALALWGAEKARLAAEIQAATGLAKVTRDPFLMWLTEQGVSTDNLQKDTLEALLADDATPPAVRDAIKMWIQKEAKAISKYTAVLNGLCDDGRARGMFQFKGASRTDRTSGRRIQLQNLKRAFALMQEIPGVVDAIRDGDAPQLQEVSGKTVGDALGGAIRHVIRAPEGMELVVCDLTSIESVVLGWLTYCDKIDETFRSGRDSYRLFATRYYNIEYDQVTKEQRSFSKPPVLGCGYMLGARGLIAYAEGYGVNMTDAQAKTAVDTFRQMYPEIPKFWTWIINTVKYVIRSGVSVTGYRLRIERDDDFMRIWLPSGRALSYYQPTVTSRPAPWAHYSPGPQAQGLSVDEIRASGKHDLLLESAGLLTADKYIDAVSYMGQNDKAQWARVYAHAGLFTENIVQSLAMDILFNGLTLAERAGLSPVLQVHDEIGCEEPASEAAARLDTLKQCMTAPPPWAQGMWLGAAGYTCKYYTKD